MKKLSKSKIISLSGVYIALSVIMVYISSIIIGSKLFLLGCASAIIPLAVITIGKRNAFWVYISSSILLLILIPKKGTFVAYITFFGIYGLIKYFIEKLNKIPLEIFLKLIFFNLCLLLYYYLFKTLLGFTPKINIPYKYAVLMMQFVLLLYDYALTLFINYIYKRIQ